MQRAKADRRYKDADEVIDVLLAIRPRHTVDTRIEALSSIDSSSRLSVQ